MWWTVIVDENVIFVVMRHFALILAAFAALSCGPRPQEETMTQLEERVFRLASRQTIYMDSLLSARQQAPDAVLCPRTFQGDSLVPSDIGWWCSGFYPGVLWQVYEYSGDETFKALAVKHTRPLEALLGRETDHDIGFQLMSSFGRMARDTGDPSCGSILRAGARTLAARFVPEAGVLRSWNGSRWTIPVIIDNMMNLELLMDYGDREVAEKHALTTARNHFREDGTTFHLVDYDYDGAILGRQTVQGYADNSAWARGQAWALYGYAMMARKEREAGNAALAKTFYDIAAKLEGWILPRLPEDGVPYWDFSQTDYRDASAGAIIASALLDLHAFRNGGPDDPALKTAEKILRTLASPDYLSEPGTNGGFLLRHSVGSLPGNSEVDVPLTYADYYFLEALLAFPENGR